MTIKIKNFLHAFFISIINKNRSFSFRQFSYKDFVNQESNKIPTFNIGNHLLEKERNRNHQFQYDTYLFHKKSSKDSVFVYDKDENPIFYIEKIKSSSYMQKKSSEFLITTDESYKTETLKKSGFIVLGKLKEIEQSSILFENRLLKIDTSTENYVIQDIISNIDIGCIKKNSGFIKDEWVIYSNDNKKIGKMSEQSTILSIIITFMSFIYGFIGIGSWLFPENYTIVSSDGMNVAEIKKNQSRSSKYRLTILQANPPIDQRLLISMGFLIANG
ncbi:MAG: hypothetical protein LRZ92_05920 [Methanosarcinaceae archaeon]|jgi:hypothetical protein|nr:hypothetical protein [Methanosarcinaceae archaeon]NKQ38167.1 hypothetical protein [Methanosarcinales archaeon]